MIPLFFEKLSMYDRVQEPCMVAVPFAQGALREEQPFTVADGGRPVPTQKRVTARWPDGSVKWLLVHFLADLPGNARKSFECRPGMPTVPPALSTAVVHRQRDGSFTIDTGALRVELGGPGETGLLRAVRSLTSELRFGSFSGPLLRNMEGAEFSPVIGEDGWEVLEEGPVRTVVAAKGKHVGADGAWFDFAARIYAYAGKPWMRLDYQILNGEQGDEQTVRALELRIGKPEGAGPSSGVRTGLGKSNYRTTYHSSDSGERLSHLITAEELKYDSYEQIPETLYGTFWADWCDPQLGGVCVTQYQAQQNFPKLLDVSADGMIVGIIPDGDGLPMLQGMAKTHRLFLHFHEPDAGLEAVNARSLQFQLPDRPVLPMTAYADAGVLEPMDVAYKTDWVERAFISLADTRPRAYGILHWGDAPDQGYTEQGRGNGDWIWLNNEYDFPHAAMHLYARTGIRRYLDYVLAATEHWIDVDICHFSDDPLRYQGHIIHSARHAKGTPKVCHQWVEGLLDYYHQTGEPSALEAALGVGENVLRILATPRYQGEGGISARESGWALRSLGALYKETYDEKWLSGCDRIVDHFANWRNKYGAWLAPYTDHTVIRVTFMIGVAVNSLMRYYQIRPQERIKDMIVEAVRDVIEYNYMPDEGVFVYKELPSLRRLNTNPIILESLAYAYEFTGDEAFLHAGRVTFEAGIKKIAMDEGGGAKQISGDAMIWWRGPRPKIFQQYYYPMFYYYRTAIRAGMTFK